MNLSGFAAAISEAIASLGAVIDTNRPIRLRLASRHSPIAQMLLPQRIDITESLYDGLDGHITCLSQRADLPLEQFKAMPLEVQLVTDRRELRLICGLVTHARRGRSADGGTAYQLSFTDMLSVMEGRINTRSFIDASVLDISRVMLGEWLQRNPGLACAFTYEFLQLDETLYPKRAFTRQANESDRAFLTRLWRESGLSWFVRPAPADVASGGDTPRHQLVVFDDSMQLPLNAAGEVLYQRPGATKQRAGITQWAGATQLVPGRVARASWNYKAARVDRIETSSLLDQGECGNDMAALLQDTVIETPHAGHNAGDHERLTLLAIQRHEFEADCSHGEGDNADMAVCEYNPIAGCPELGRLSASEREFIPIRLRHVGENNLPHELQGHANTLLAASGRIDRWQAHPRQPEDDAARYRNSFIAVRRTRPIVPAWNPARDFPPTPPVHAVVVGPPGQEVWCDELGRVKIEFHGLDPQDHEHAQGAGTNMNEASSAWVQWATLWAGRTEGLDAIPRIGMQVVVHFMAGDPSRPYIAGCLHGGRTPPVNPQHVGNLPGNRHITSLQSREIHGSRYGGLLAMDDTPGEIGIKVASEHGHSQHNQGWIGTPRSDGKSHKRGEGFEQCTDLAGAMRAGSGLLISTDARPRASGQVLDRQELLGQLDTVLAVAQKLAELSLTHEADGTDTAPLHKLVEQLEAWDSKKPGGAPAIAISAPSGIAMSSPNAIVTSSGTNLDMVAVQDANLSTGRKLVMRAAQGLSAFVHKAGMKLVAAAGKISIQAHSDELELAAAKQLHAYSLESMLFQAPKIVLQADGASITLGDGRIVLSATSEIAGLAAQFNFGSGGGGGISLPDMPHSSLATDERMAFVGRGGQALAKVPYEVRDTSTGAVLDAGEAAGDGATQTIVTDNAIKALTVHLKP